MDGTAEDSPIEYVPVRASVACTTILCESSVDQTRDAPLAASVATTGPASRPAWLSGPSPRATTVVPDAMLRHDR